MTSFPVILCVEDNDDSRSLVELMLRLDDDSYTIVSIKTAAGAINLMKKQTFDLYILDFRMPVMSGVEICKKIRETDKQTPIMFFSAMARLVDRTLGMAAGANEYLIKPDDLSCLTETVKRLLNERKTNSELISDLNGTDTISNYQVGIQTQ